MLNNAGKKIILWSNVLLILGIAVSVAFGFLVIWRGAQIDNVRFSVYHTGYLTQTGFLGGTRVILAGFLVMIFGSLASWIAALLLRAFGDLTEDTRAIRERLEEAPAKVEVEIEAEEPGEAKAEAVVAETPMKKPAAPRTRKSAKPKAEAPAAEKPEETTQA